MKKIIAYILLFAGTTNLIRGLATSNGEPAMFGVMFLVIGGLILKYSTNDRKE